MNHSNPLLKKSLHPSIPIFPRHLQTSIEILIYRNGMRKKGMQMIFIDPDKAYDEVPRDVMWWLVSKVEKDKAGIYLLSQGYVSRRKNKCEMCLGVKQKFPITIKTTSRICIKPFHSHNNNRWTKMVYLGWDIVVYVVWERHCIHGLMDEIRDKVNARMKRWKQVLESWRFRLSDQSSELLYV